MTGSPESPSFWDDPERSMAVITVGSLAMFGSFAVMQPNSLAMVAGIATADTAINVGFWLRIRHNRHQSQEVAETTNVTAAAE